MLNRRALTFLSCCALIPLSGCNPTTLGIAASPLFVQTDHVNLLSMSYAAADQLSVQTQRKFSKDKPLVVTSLEEIVHTKSTLGGKKEITIHNPKLGALMTDQLKARFVQLGYNVTNEGAGAKAAVTGVYEAVGKKLAVRIRMMDLKTGTQLGVYDYWMPITPDIRRHMDPNSGGIPLYKMREGLSEMID